MVLWYLFSRLSPHRIRVFLLRVCFSPLYLSRQDRKHWPHFFRQNNCGDARITWVVTAMKLLDNSTCRCQLLWGRKAMDDTNGYYYCICYMRYVQWILLSMHIYIYVYYIYIYIPLGRWITRSKHPESSGKRLKTWERAFNFKLFIYWGELVSKTAYISVKQPNSSSCKHLEIDSFAHKLSRVRWLNASSKVMRTYRDCI